MSVELVEHTPFGPRLWTTAPGAVVSVERWPPDVRFMGVVPARVALRQVALHGEWGARRRAFSARLGAMGAMFDAIDWRWPRA